VVTRVPEFLHLTVPAAELALRSVAIYGALLLGLRLFGKREVGQFTIFDLVLILLVANAVQPAMTGPDTSLTGGLVIIVSLLVANFVVARLDRLEFFHRLFTPSPTLLVKDGQLQLRNMRREGVDRQELEMAAREHGIATVAEVKIGMLESDGSISIVGKEGVANRHRRRVRSNRPGA